MKKCLFAGLGCVVFGAWLTAFGLSQSGRAQLAAWNAAARVPYAHLIGASVGKADTVPALARSSLQVDYTGNLPLANEGGGFASVADTAGQQAPAPALLDDCGWTHGSLPFNASQHGAGPAHVAPAQLAAGTGGQALCRNLYVTDDRLASAPGLQAGALLLAGAALFAYALRRKQILV